MIMFDDILFCCISKWNWSDEYSIRRRIQKCGEGGNGAWVFGAVGAGAREKESEPGARTRKMDSEPGLETEKKESEPGARTRKMESEPGPERR